MSDTFDFKLDGEMVKSVLKGQREAVTHTHMNLTVLDMHPEDAKKLNEEMVVAPMPWITLRENEAIELGSARLSLAQD